MAILRSGGFNLRMFTTYFTQLQEKIDESEATHNSDTLSKFTKESEETFAKSLRRYIQVNRRCWVYVGTLR